MRGHSFPPEGTGNSVKPTKTLTEEPFSLEKMEFGCEDIAEEVQKEIGGQKYRITSKIPGRDGMSSRTPQIKNQMYIFPGY